MLNKTVVSQKQVDALPKDFIKINKQKIARISKLELMSFIQNDGQDQDPLVNESMLSGGFRTKNEFQMEAGRRN